MAALQYPKSRLKSVAAYATGRGKMFVNIGCAVEPATGRRAGRGCLPAAGVSLRQPANNSMLFRKYSNSAARPDSLQHPVIFTGLIGYFLILQPIKLLTPSGYCAHAHPGAAE